MAAEEILPGIHAVPIRLGILPYVNAFLIVGQEVVLVDTGLPRRAGVLAAAVRAAGRRPSDVRHVLVTHHHADHTGNLADVVRATGATAYVHSLDAPVVRGERPAPGPSRPGPLITLLEWYGRRSGLSTAEPCPTFELVQDGQDLDLAGGVRVLHTPGHTPGHVSYFLPSRRLLFAGDAAGALLGRVGTPLGSFTEDMDRAKQSIRALAELDFDVACFGHGSVIRRDGASRFRALVEKLAR